MKRATFLCTFLTLLFQGSATAESRDSVSNSGSVEPTTTELEEASLSNAILPQKHVNGFFPFLQAESFFRNNEYTSPYGVGYTLAGYRLKGALGYRTTRILESVELYLGLHTLGYFGAERYPPGTWYRELPWNFPKGGNSSALPKLFPLFGLKLAFNPNLSLHFGHYGKEIGHRLPMPLYNKELMLSANPEQGVRFLVQYPCLWADFWIDWQRFIFRGDPQQEAFTTGMSLQLPIYKKHRFQLSGKAAWVASHRGGEVNVMQEGDAVRTYFAGMIGLKVSYQTPVGASKRALELVLSGYGTFSRMPPEASSSSGKGLFLQTQARYRSIHGAISYWQGEDFTSPMGGPFVNSRSLWESNNSSDTRHKSFISFSLGYTFYRTEQISLELEANVWQHLRPTPEKSNLSHALTLYVSFTPELSFRHK